MWNYLKHIVIVLLVMLLVMLLSACGGGSTSLLTEVSGAGVKGPLAGAIVRLYQVDPDASDLKGALLDEGTTGADASINGLSIDEGISGLVLLEFVADADTIDLNTGVAPVIDHLTTVIDVQRIYDGDDIYATPLTTMAVSLTQANADKGSPYAGNGDDTTTSVELTAALAVAQNQVKSTLGFGLDSSVDIFTVPPILTADTTTAEKQARVVKYRAAIEAVAALADKVATDSSASDTTQEIFDGLAEDLKDGTIDGMNDTAPVAILAALDMPIDTTVGSLDPTTLVIPNTTTPITDIKQTLTDEMTDTGEVVDTTPLATVNVDPIPPVLVAVSEDTYAIGGTVSGLSGSVVLQNNGGDDLTLTANSGFAFSTPIVDGNSYNVSVLTQPAGQTCTASSNTGTVSGSNVTSVVVTCVTNTYSIGGNVTGLTGSVVLQNNDGDDLTVNANGAFTFSTPIAYGNTYNVSVLIQPVGQTCTASTNSGTVGGANITSVAITCSTNTYTIGGSVTGLSGSVVMQNNGGDDLTVNADGAFTFSTSISEGGGYSVTILSQPSGQICAASSSTGSVSGANVTSVVVSCVNTYTVGGMVSGLTGGVVLQNNSGDDLTVNANGAFNFSTPLINGSGFNVTVKTQPTGQTCTVSNFTGFVIADVTNVTVTCTNNNYTIGGTVSGLSGSVILQNNGGDDLSVNADGNFTFSTPVAHGAAYSVSVLTQPSGQTCTASSNSGTVNAANVTSVSLFCAPNPVLDAEAKPASATLSWNDTGATSYNIYYSTAPGCDIANYASCAGGAMVANVTSPYTVSALTNGQNYWFQLESVAAGGNGVSNEVGTRPDQLIPNGDVNAIVHDTTSGVTYLGGAFTKVGLATGNGVPLSMTTGHPAAFPHIGRSGGWGYVNVAVSDGAGGYYIGGFFDTVGGQMRDNLAHILADGTLGPWNPSADDQVQSLAVSGSTVYVGGRFTSITDSNGTQTRNYLAAIDSITGTVTSWNPDASGNASPFVYAIAVSGNSVYVGGAFTSFGGGTYSRNYLAAFDTSSASPSVPTSWDPNANIAVFALAVSGDTVYAGGFFTSFGGGTYSRSRIAAFDTSSATPSIPTDWNPSANNGVIALAVSGSTVYAGGYFTAITGTGGGTSGSYLTAIDAASGQLTTWNPIVNKIVNTLTVSGSTVYVGGQFTSIDDGNGAQARNYLAAIGTDGTLESWNPSAGDWVNTLAVSGSTVYAGGEFSSMGNEARSKLAAINADGSLSTTWQPTAVGVVRALALSGNTVYAGGEFTTIDDGSGAQGRNRLAAIDTDGNLTSWDPGADNVVRALATYNGTVFVGGDFNHISNGLPFHNFLAALDSSGNLTGWSPVSAGHVYALAVSSTGTVYVGGSFASITDINNTLSDASLAAFDGTNGILVPYWTPYTNQKPRAIAVSDSTGTVYVGGDFTNADDNQGTVLQSKYLAAIGADGKLDTTWQPNANAPVYAITLSGSRVYAGGKFTTIDDGNGALGRNYLAAIGTDGSLDAWNPTANGYVNVLTTSGSTLHAGGSFYYIDGESRANFSVMEP